MAELQAGDRLTVGTTHEVNIDGLKSWIKTEVNSAIQEGESVDEAYDRVGGIVARKAVSEIERQAQPIVEANRAQRRR